MDTHSLRAKLRALSYGIFGFIIAIIFIRILLMVLGANPNANFVIFWYDLSDNFVNIFRGMYPNLEPERSSSIVEIYSIIAMVFYMLLAFLVSKMLTSVVESDGVQIIKNIVDTIFKVLEFFLITRFILKLTGASAESIFVNFIYGVSAIFYEPFQGIFPTFKVADFNIIFETSILIAIIVIVIFDIITEGIIDNLRPVKNSHLNNPASMPNQPANNFGTMSSPFGGSAPATSQSQPNQNITINIPQPVQQPYIQPPVVDRRTVQVFPTVPVANYPGLGSNHLESQRPRVNGQLPSRRP
jgi:uncharacterized protein YggT (Ycf19 family)